MMLKCTTSPIDNSHFSKWTPLIGIYIAAATLVCAIAIIGDLRDGLRSGQHWIPSWYASLNSISLTILGAATKLSMDLSTPMPRQIDQLVKLGTSAFMCIAIASIQPSIGKLKNTEVLSNTVALSILVISSIVSLVIQLRTGVISTFKTAHIIILTMMSFVLLHMITSAMVHSYSKWFFQTIYQDKECLARKKCIGPEDNKHIETKKLEQYLKRFCMLAHSGCPHFLLSRSAQGILITSWGLVAAIAFFVTQITSIARGDKFLASRSSSSISAYNWSVLWIYVTQTIALGVGTIVLCFRWCYASMVQLKGMVDSDPWKGDAGAVNKFWMKIDVSAAIIHYDYDFIDYSQHKGRRYRLMIPYGLFRIFFRTKLVGISFLIYNIIDLFWSYTITRCITSKLPRSPSPTTPPDGLVSEEEELSEQYICPLPEMERKGSVKWIIKSILSFTKRCMSPTAKQRNTEYLEELLRLYLSPDFRRVVSFDTKQVASLDLQESPPNCWSLPVATLAGIAIALPGVDRDSVVKLKKGVMEGLVLAKLIEDKFNDQPQLNTIRFAAYHQLKGGFKLFAESGREPDKSPIKILQSFAASAEDYFRNHGDDRLAMRKVSAHSYYRLSMRLLAEQINENLESAENVDVLPSVEQGNENTEPTQDDSKRVFEKLRAIIADILGACLTNLKHYILKECSDSSSIEQRRKVASRLLRFFADTEGIMKIVEAKEIPNLSPEKMVFIDEWRKYYQEPEAVPLAAREN